MRFPALFMRTFIVESEIRKLPSLSAQVGHSLLAWMSPSGPSREDRATIAFRPSFELELRFLLAQRRSSTIRAHRSPPALNVGGLVLSIAGRRWSGLKPRSVPSPDAEQPENEAERVEPEADGPQH